MDSEKKIYETLYYHAFNRLTDLGREIESIQAELEEMYLRSTDGQRPEP